MAIELAPDRERRRLLKGAGAGTLLASVPPLAIAQDSLIALKDFFRAPQASQLRLSPDGKHIVGVRPVKDRANLFVFDIEAHKSTIITSFSDGDAVAPRWISNDRILFGVQDTRRGSGDQLGTGLLAIDRNAGDFKELSDRSFVSGDARLLPVSTFYAGRAAGGGPDDVHVSVWSTGGSRVYNSSNIYRLNTRSGRNTLVTAGGPGKVIQWGFDRAGVPRLAQTSDKGLSRVHYRASAEAAWAVIAEFRLDDPAGITPLAIGDDGKLLVLARAGSDFVAVHRFDPASRKLDAQPVLALKGYDLDPDAVPGQPATPGDPLIIEDGEILGVRYQAERSGTHWLSAPHAQVQLALEATFPGASVAFQGDPRKKDQPLLVAVGADTEPGRFFLFHQGKRQLQAVAAVRPWLASARLAPMEVYRYRARDGLSIPATLTVPRGAERKNLPLVVLHYGGPWVRAIRWGYDSRVQFLASRGYAVFMPAPRGSTGYGWQHFRAGWRQWGLAMQDDVTDGVRDLIAKGVVDPKRICLAGASYGGYLAMMGLAKEPALFRCGINWVGVTDPELMYIEWTDFAAGDSREVSLPVLLGDPKTDAEQFARTSPLKRAAEIRQPVLLAYGGADRRVPIVNGERMRDALKDHNPNVEWVVYGDEGHGWMKDETHLDFWGRVEAFLGRHMT